MPNQPQALRAKLVIVGLASLMPAVGLAIGAALFSRFELDEAALLRARRERGANAGATSSPGQAPPAAHELTMR